MIDIDLDSIKRKAQGGIPKISGVYFLFRKKELLYIGSSDDIAKRLKTHRKYSPFTFDQHYIYHVHPEQ